MVVAKFVLAFALDVPPELILVPRLFRLALGRLVTEFVVREMEGLDDGRENRRGKDTCREHRMLVSFPLTTRNIRKRNALHCQEEVPPQTGKGEVTS